MKWKTGELTELLHYVGDDPTKWDIENELAEEFKDEPEILDRIISVVYKIVEPQM